MWSKKNAANHKDLDALKLAFEYLLTTPDFNYEEFSGGRYPYDGEEIREIIEVAYQTIWSDSSLPVEAPDIEIIQMPLEEWWIKRERL